VTRQPAPQAAIGVRGHLGSHQMTAVPCRRAP
jgi:hypothetical protein